MDRCAHCDTRLSGNEFSYQGQPLCCECMSTLTSWFLDGGQCENPDQFADSLGIAVHDGSQEREGH